MKELTKKQRESLDRIDKRIAEKDAEWSAEVQSGGMDGHVTIHPDTTLETIWNEMVELKAERNELRSKYRAEGRNI